jgi:hypothetical protein
VPAGVSQGWGPFLPHGTQCQQGRAALHTCADCRQPLWQPLAAAANSACLPCCSAAAAGAASAFDFTLALLPRRSAVAERILEERGVLGDVAMR